ncbi:hypothetical protein [Helicobacter kayseriensis]|uniref:hypothetical protein n=1 Tax=Helicobacter kayseriensis TaxID=2905877 RepID=UPI001E62C1D4|nr:hypothetical protein [Helicobacter kayseriensis]MCE3047575.1 hypothetical protein [Helicobacter kayseriensis]MCE3048946.1 hypothetical protein [Helicobacter kayseriensis]
MKLWIKGIYFSVLGIVFSGCANLFFNPNLDLSLSTLPSVQVLPDVSSVAFEWKRVNDSNIDGFVVYRKEGKGEFERIAIIRNPLATHFYDRGLKPESVYQYSFAILGKNNRISQRSKILKVKTSFIQPVDTLFASSDEPRLVKLVWSVHANPSIKKYVIEKKIKNQWSEIAEVKDRLNVEYYDRNLLDGTTYEYRIAGVSFEGDKSRYSEVAKATTKFPPPLLENITASQNIPKLIILKWDDSKINDLAGYVIYASQKEEGRFEKIAETLKPYYEFRTDKNGMKWFFKVVAVDKDGIQGSLNQIPVCGTSLIPPNPPMIKGASVHEGEAIIGWEKPSERVMEVNVYRKEGAFGTPLKFKLPASATRFVDKEMKVGVDYVYWVEFVDVNQIPSSPSQEFKLKRE